MKKIYFKYKTSTPEDNLHRPSPDPKSIIRKRQNSGEDHMNEPLKLSEDTRCFARRVWMFCSTDSTRLSHTLLSKVSVCLLHGNTHSIRRSVNNLVSSRQSSETIARLLILLNEDYSHGIKSLKDQRRY